MRRKTEMKMNTSSLILSFKLYTQTSLHIILSVLPSVQFLVCQKAVYSLVFERDDDAFF